MTCNLAPMLVPQFPTGILSHVARSRTQRRLGYMARMPHYVTDLAHAAGWLEHGAPDVPRAKRLALHQLRIVAASTALPHGVPWVVAIRCIGRHPGEGRPATVVLRDGEEATIRWNCERCGLGGTIDNWSGSRWDMRPARGELPGDAVAVLSWDAFEAAREVVVGDRPAERLFAAALANEDDWVEVAGPVSTFRILAERLVAAGMAMRASRRRDRVLEAGACVAWACAGSASDLTQ